MKSFKVNLLVLTITILVMALPSFTFAQTPGWQLYDDFSKGAIDTTKWIVDNSSATIIVKNGVAIFAHNTNYPNDSNWLEFKKWPEKIKAVRAKVKIVNDRPGDVRARIGGWLGKNNAGDWVWLNMQLRNDYDRIDAEANALDPKSTPQFNLKYNLFHSQVGKPDGLVGNWYTLEAYFNRFNLLFQGNAVKKIAHQLTEKVNPPDDYFKGIGTRNGTAVSGTCTVYFDDVWVLY